jgi:CHASE2 domain-containing sensor protein
MMLPYKDQKTQWQRWIIGASVIAGIGVILVVLPLGDGLATLSYDLPFLFRSSIADTNVVVVLEDRASLDALGEKSWPPSRTVHARLVDRLREEGAKLIVFDIVFRNERPGEDEVLATALRKQGQVILGCVPEISTHQLGDHPGTQLAELKPPIDVLRTNAAAWGVLVVGNLDSKFGVRKMTTAWHGRDSVVWLAAGRTGALGAAETPTAERWINFYGAPPAVDRVTLGEVLSIGDHRLAPGYLRGKIVFVGFDPAVTPASGARDVFSTPYTRFGHEFAPGVEVLANACANLVRGNWMRRVETFLQAALAAGFGLVATALLIWLGRRGALPTAAVLMASLFCAALFLPWQTGFWWNWLVLAAIQLPLAVLLSFLCPRLPVLAFISYRRDSGDKFALYVRSELRRRGYEAFLDVVHLKAGEFPEQLLRQIRTSPKFVLILAPTSLDARIHNETDWMRREIAQALQEDKEIIPILIDGAKLSAKTALPADITPLCHCQAIRHDHHHADVTVEKLLRFLLKKRRPGVKAKHVSS